MDRRLTTIVAADIAGFSRLVGADEEGTLAAQRAHRAELVDPLIAEHGGRIANTAGDSLLIEFPSAVQAVRCAVAAQAGMAERNEGVPEDRRVVYRIGINIGDVVPDGEDLLGDGVNIAARLEALAPPGGIVVSGTVYDQVRDRGEVTLAELGEVEVKNIARPVRAYQVLREGEAAIRVAKPTRRRWGWVAAAAVVMALLIGGGYWYAQRPDMAPANRANFAHPLPDKPSIAVLAFDNLSGDADQEFLSDGLTEDIIAALARVPGIFVVARNSSFVYKGQPVKVQTVAEELGVRYVLEGSVQRDGDRLRVTAQLIDALNGAHVWSSKYDREINDLFAVKDEITKKIASSMSIELVYGDFHMAKETRVKNLEAWLLAHRALALWQTVSRENHVVGRAHVEKALEIEPTASVLNSSMTWHLAREVQMGWTEDPKKNIAEAIRYGEKAIELDPKDPDPPAALAYVYMLTGNWDKAVELAKLSVELAPSDGNTLAMLGYVYQKISRAEESIELIDRALRLNPRANYWVKEALGESLVIAKQYERAISVYEAALADGMEGSLRMEAHLGLALSHDGLGDPETAKKHVKKALEISPKISVSYLRKVWIYTDLDYEERQLATLKRLGLPEE